MDSAEESQDPSPLLFRCSVCSELRDHLNGSTCSVCVTPILVSLWPRLIEVLEQKYGRLLDEWLENGRFEGLRWSVSPEFTVPRGVPAALRPEGHRGRRPQGRDIVRAAGQPLVGAELRLQSWSRMFTPGASLLSAGSSPGSCRRP